MTYWGDISAQADYLANTALPKYGVTGFSVTAAEAWLRNEGQAIPNPTNPLNIMSGGTPGQTGGAIGAAGEYPSWQAGLDAVAWLLTHNSAYAGVVASAPTGNAYDQVAAIEASPWAGSHYGAKVAQGHLLEPGNLQSTVSSLVGGTAPVVKSSVSGSSSVAQPTAHPTLQAAPITEPTITAGMTAQQRAAVYVQRLTTAEKAGPLSASQQSELAKYQAEIAPAAAAPAVVSVPPAQVNITPAAPLTSSQPTQAATPAPSSAAAPVSTMQPAPTITPAAPAKVTSSLPSVKLPAVGTVSTESDYLAVFAIAGLAVAIVLLLVVASQ